MSNGGMFRVDWLSDMTPRQYLEHRLQQVGLSEIKIHSVVREISTEWGWEWLTRESNPLKPREGHGFLLSDTHDPITVSVVKESVGAICQHGCTHGVRLTNIEKQQEWVVCMRSFERMLIDSFRRLY